MADAAPTIPSLKESFINAQTNILSRPLVPSRIWRRNNNASSTPIPARVLDDVLFNLNQTIQLHQRRVYPPQATYNVAEQITNLYTRDADEKVKKWKESESSIGRELDLAADDAIEELPSSWPIESDLGRYQEKAKQYEGIVLRLRQLSEERKEMRLRMEKLRRIRDAVQPLSATDESNIQDNLVTRNGPVEKELERMRVLLARVTSRVANLPEQPASDRPQSITSSTVDLGEMTRWGKRKIDSFLADPRVFPP
ncbi:Inner kinetochore subunit fta4 [Metarhizium anisopliae]|nr:Inner kinetochore subunit fta4 [Metarhizium anisopliae]